jgi:hypothetical protein
MDEKLQQLEAAMVAAHRAGDTASAQKLAAEITRLRSVSPTTRAMLEALKTTPPERWESRMADAGYDPETIAEVMQAGGIAPAAPPVGPRAAAPDSAFTFAASQTPQDIPRGRDVSPEALAAATVAPTIEASAPPFSSYAPTAATDPREAGREEALRRDSRVGSALQGYGSFMFGAGTPATAAAVMASRALPGGKEPIGPGDAMEYARGIREGSYESDPWAYRGGAAAGLAGGVSVARAALTRAPAVVQTVFSPQSGQTFRNLLRLAGVGGAAAGTTALSEHGPEAVPTAAAAGAAAGPLGVGAFSLARAGIGRLRPTSTAIRVLSAHLGEPAAALAARYNRFVEVMGRAPRLIEIMRRETSEELGQVARSKVGTDAARVFRDAEEAAALARPDELSGLVRRGGTTSTVPAQEALLAPTARETSETLGQRVQSTEAAQIGRRDVRMDRVMEEIGGQRIPVTDDMLDVLQHPDVWNNLDAGLRRGLAQTIETGQELGSVMIPVRAWDAIRQDLSARAGAGAGQIYARLRDRVRDYVSERVPEYGRALSEFGRRTDVARGTTAGTRALTASAREFADAVRTAGGGTAGTAQRQGVRTAEQAGMRVGARTALANALSGPPNRVRQYMTRLARDPRLQGNLREVLSEAEMGQLERLAARYGRRLDLRAGVETGRRVAARNTGEAFEDAVAQAAATPAGRAGVAAGARGALADVAGESPAGAVSTAQRLAQDPGLARRIESALGGREAGRLREVGELATTASENLSAAAPRATQAQLRIQAVSQQTQEAITAMVAATGRASGALLANLGNNMVQRYRLSPKAARKLAEIAVDPARAHQAIATLRRLGASADEILELYQDAAVAAGITVAQ